MGQNQTKRGSCEYIRMLIRPAVRYEAEASDEALGGQ